MNTFGTPKFTFIQPKATTTNMATTVYSASFTGKPTVTVKDAVTVYSRRDSVEKKEDASASAGAQNAIKTS
jgi:hypothetical protein